MDSQLVSMIRGLEQEAEQVLLDAKSLAASRERETAANVEAKSGRIMELTEIEVGKIIEQGRLETEEELAKTRSTQNLELEESIRRASTRLDQAAQYILEELKRS